MPPVPTPQRQLIREVKVNAAEMESSLRRLGDKLVESGLATSAGNQMLELADMAREIQIEFNKIIESCIFLQRQTP